MNEHILLPRPERLRSVPERFSWCDQRLFRLGLTACCSSDALALYLLLLTVADSRGLSYYSDNSLSRMLRLDLVALSAARTQLLAADLIAYRRPHYQLLSLPDANTPPPSERLGRVASVGEILRRVLNPTGGDQ